MCNKNKNDGQYDERGAAPCKCCKRSKKLSYPKIVNVDELYYAQCPECRFYDIYEFLGVSEKRAIEIWNETMELKKDALARRAYR